MLFNDLFYLQYHFHTHHIEYLPKCLERRIAHASLQILDCRDAYAQRYEEILIRQTKSMIFRTSLIQFNYIPLISFN